MSGKKRRRKLRRRLEAQGTPPDIIDLRLAELRHEQDAARRASANTAIPLPGDGGTRPSSGSGPRPQKGKHRKRAKEWHRGAGEATRWRLVNLPEVGSGADPTAGAPQPLRRTKQTNQATGAPHD